MLVDVDVVPDHADGVASGKCWGHAHASALRRHGECLVRAVRLGEARFSAGERTGGEVDEAPAGIGAHQKLARFVAQVEVAVGKHAPKPAGKRAQRNLLVQAGCAVDDNVPMGEDPSAHLGLQNIVAEAYGISLEGHTILEHVDDGGNRHHLAMVDLAEANLGGEFKDVVVLVAVRCHGCSSCFLGASPHPSQQRIG